MAYFPQTLDDESLFDNFRDVVYKYNQMRVDGMITIPTNGTYPRLCISHNRGERAGRELLNFICKNLINYPPISLLDDIMNAEFCFNTRYELLGSTQPVSFMTLRQNIPEYKLLNVTPPYNPEFYKLNSKNT